MRESQAKFKKMSEDLESAITKHVSTPRTKIVDCEEAASQLQAAKLKFTVTAMDYSDKVKTARGVVEKVHGYQGMKQIFM